MLEKLDADIVRLEAVDSIDETKSNQQWSKKAQTQLERLNKDCNLTAGLEAVLYLAEGARVMLHRNIDTKNGLVNGCLGTVRWVKKLFVNVQFDHLPKPTTIERARSKFQVLKIFYVYRKQFPLIPAYTITIHKCQGLSLDRAIIDLSDRVFSPGMAYVALSRVRTIEGVYLTSFDPKSIMVSNHCLREINRLRSTFREDLPLYVIPEIAITRKRRLTGVDGEIAAPPPKIPKLFEPLRKARKLVAKRKCSSAIEKPVKKQREQESNKRVQPSGPPRPVQTTLPNFRFHNVDEEWQRRWCAELGLQYCRPYGGCLGSSTTV